jgi:hypothetical protein
MSVIYLIYIWYINLFIYLFLVIFVSLNKDNSLDKVLYFKESMDYMCDLFKIGYRQDYGYLYGHPIALYGNLQLPPVAMGQIYSWNATL